MKRPPNPAMYFAFLVAAERAIHRQSGNGVLTLRVANALQRNSYLASR